MKQASQRLFVWASADSKLCDQWFPNFSRERYGEQQLTQPLDERVVFLGSMLFQIIFEHRTAEASVTILQHSLHKIRSPQQRRRIDPRHPSVPPFHIRREKW